MCVGRFIGNTCLFLLCPLPSSMGWLFLQLLPLVSNKHMISLYSRPTRVFSQAIIGWRHAQVPRRYPHLCMHPTDPRLWINGSVAIDLTALDPEPEEELARECVCVCVCVTAVCVCLCACLATCLSSVYLCIPEAARPHAPCVLRLRPGPCAIMSPQS